MHVGRLSVCIGGVALLCAAGCGSNSASDANGNGAGVGAPVSAPQQAIQPGAQATGVTLPGAAGTIAPPISTGGTAAPVAMMMMVMPKPGTGGAGGTTAPGTGGTGGMMSTMPTMPVTPAMCPAAPADAPANAVQAWMAVNQLRVAAGAPCMNLVPALVKSAQAHCDYGAANASNASCTPDAHTEVMGCTGFTGAMVAAREVAAGYPMAMAYTEVATTFGNNPVAAVPNWIDTVFHRIPLLDPWTMDMGYGGAAKCDVIDIGRGTSTAATDLVAVYPYDGQTNVPPAWGGLEGPAPPAPAGGFPSSYPINIYAQGLMVTSHVLTKDGDSTPIDHTWLDSNSSQVSAGLKAYFRDTAFLYGAPFELNTKYRVKIMGTHTGGALNKEWTFTTGSMRPFGT
ncbi:MAG TPA: hypothetical protein VL176_14460 [Steroidobacteraceae bacterium]|nr:hypothetical protein [Steroidobacteraceae bacterium]